MSRDAEPLATVVVPSYNHRHYLRETLEGIIDQTYERLEVVVVDDGSTDGSDRLLRAWADSPRVRSRFVRVVIVSRERNLGAHATLNEGVTAGRGRNVFLINSDDRFAPERVETLTAVLNDAELSLAFSGVRFIDHVGAAFQGESFLRHEAEVSWILSQLPTTGFGFLHYQWSVSTGNLAFTRSLFDSLAGFTDLKYCHDWDFVLRAALKTEPVYVDQQLYDYRVHPGNTFASLAHLSEPETEAVIRRFWTMANLERFMKFYAPTKYNWPEVFELVRDRVATKHLLVALDALHPRYVARRTGTATTGNKS